MVVYKVNQFYRWKNVSLAFYVLLSEFIDSPLRKLGPDPKHWLQHICLYS